METSELSKRIYDIVVEEVETIYPQFMKKVNNIDLDYFEDIVRDSEEMPKELNFELREKVLDDVKLYAMQLIEKSNIKTSYLAVVEQPAPTTIQGVRTQSTTNNDAIYNLSGQRVDETYRGIVIRNGKKRLNK